MLRERVSTPDREEIRCQSQCRGAASKRMKIAPAVTETRMHVVGYFQSSSVFVENRTAAPKIRPGIGRVAQQPPLTPMRCGGYTAFGEACFRGAGPGSMAQTSARRSTVTLTGRRRRASEDVARETFCSTCSPRVGGNNTGYAATSGPD